MDERLSPMKGPEQGPIAVLDPDGRFGHWITDECDLSAYEYTADQDNDPTAAVFTTQGPSNLHWHQVGNDRLTAIATNRGEVQALKSSRGLQRLNYRDRGAASAPAPTSPSYWTKKVRGWTSTNPVWCHSPKLMPI